MTERNITFTGMNFARRKRPLKAYQSMITLGVVRESQNSHLILYYFTEPDGTAHDKNLNQQILARLRAIADLSCLIMVFKPYLSKIWPIILCLCYSIHVNPAQRFVVPTSPAAMVTRSPGAINNLLRGEFQQSTCLKKIDITITTR